ncbi:MAG: thermonuclease family protein [Nitrospira sp.]|nr:thermonuclease family protein [Nitrospira sp.]
MVQRMNLLNNAQQFLSSLRITVLVAGLLLSGGEAFSFGGQVVAILDGGTIEVVRNGKAQRVRLNGVACPKGGQPYSEQAKQATSDLGFSMDVTLQIYGKDKHGRVVADVLLPDDTNMSHLLVQQGWCWWDRKQAPGDVQLEALEKEARDSQRGLWADQDPVPPWEWRKNARASTP